MNETKKTNKIIILCIIITLIATISIPTYYYLSEIGYFNSIENTIEFDNISVDYAYSQIVSWTCSACLHVIDVRTPEEFAEGYINISNSKVLGPINIDFYVDFNESMLQYDSLYNRFGLFEDTYLIYCKSGYRSALSAQYMVNVGFKNVYNTVGGIEAYKDANYPVDGNISK